ncbi:hypothetical protein [Nitrosopumilus sp.]|uniref:hypothetical protein n=1 Tax=Nitrosopumilus sp. TaxID=2024843 RepID=UPI003B5C0475
MPIGNKWKSELLTKLKFFQKSELLTKLKFFQKSELLTKLKFFQKSELLTKLKFFQKLKIVIISSILIGMIITASAKIFNISISGTDTLIIEIFFGLTITILVYYFSKRDNEKIADLMIDIHKIETRQQGMIENHDHEIEEQREKRQDLEKYLIEQIMIDLRKMLNDYEYLKDSNEFEKIGHMNEGDRNSVVGKTFEKIMIRWGIYHENLDQEVIISIDKTYQKVYEFIQPSSQIQGNMKRKEEDLMEDIDKLYDILDKKMQK